MQFADTKDGFYGASRARQIALGQASGGNTILIEINQLQLLVDTAASGGGLEIVVSTTPMAASTDYFNAFNDPFNNDTAADKLYREAMNIVISYFSQLGYSITRKRVGVTNLFEWKLQW